MFSLFARRANRKFIMKAVLTVALSVCFPALSMALPTEARLSALENCQFLGKVEGFSGYGKNNDWQRMAEGSALQRAENLGASHVVWERMISVGVFNGYAVARAYSCSS